MSALLAVGLTSAALLQPTCRVATYHPTLATVSPPHRALVQQSRASPISFSMSQLVTAPTTPAARDTMSFVTRWLARAIILAAILATPALNLRATSLQLAFPAPSVAVPAILQAKLLAARAWISALMEVVAAEVVKLLPAAADAAAKMVELLPAAAEHLPSAPVEKIGAATAMALGSSAVVCAAFPAAKTITPMAEPALATSVEAVSPTVLPEAEPEKAAATLATRPPVKRPPASRPVLKMIVRGLPAHVSPHRLLQEFPHALGVEALFHKASGSRASIVLTFDAGRLPAVRTSAALGATLHAVVHAPKPCAEYSKVTWERVDKAAANVKPALVAASRSPPKAR